MTARSIGNVLAAAGPGKRMRALVDGMPVRVWCNSYYEGTFEHRFWRPIGDGRRRGARRRIGAIMRAAREMELRTRRERQRTAPGSRNGVLGQIGLDVLRVLYEIVDYASGRLEPAVATIAERVGHSYAAVHAALNRLRRHGFLHWVRRSRPLDRKGEAGPQVEQVTNAYVLTLPDKIEKMVRWLMAPNPAPDDASWSAEQRQAEWNGMLTQLSAVEALDATWTGDAHLGETLRNLAAALDARDRQERESSKAKETGSIPYE